MRRASLLVAFTAFAAACALSDGSGGEVAQVEGNWDFSGDQVAPALTFIGTLVIQTQDRDLIGGQLSWQEPDGMGGSLARGGPVTGRVLGAGDIDFDALVGGNTRRHLARISHDSLVGVWVESGTGKSGAFLAVRTTP